jgi:ferrochelatase
LDDVLAGRPVPPSRYEEVVRQYESAGGSSPYNRLARGLADGLSRRFASNGRAVPAYVAFRHATPGITEVLKQMAADGVTRAAGVIFSSFRSEPSWGRYLTAFERARADVPYAPSVRFLLPWCDDALFQRALLDRVREGEASISVEARADAHWLFTAHSIPVSDDHTSRYADQIRRVVQRVAEAADHVNWELCFQSRSGRPEDPWLAPDVNDVVSALSPARSLDVLTIPVGFVVDHMEVLYDLDVKLKRSVEAAGLSYHRAPTVGDHPAFLELLHLRSMHALGSVCEAADS